MKVVLSIAPIGQCTFKRIPEGRAVIWFNEMTQFMHDDVVYYTDRELQHSPVEI